MSNPEEDQTNSTWERSNILTCNGMHLVDGIVGYLEEALGCWARRLMCGVWRDFRMLNMEGLKYNHVIRLR